MQSVLRSIRTRPPAVFSSPLAYNFGRKSFGIGFQQAVAGTNGSEGGGSMNHSAQKQREKGETMSSLGEGYTTRSDEEGFGGVYGGKQELPKDEEEKIIHANSPEFDKNQGIEVNETEKARHQKDVQS